MSYRIRRDESPQAALHRIAREEARRAIAEALDPELADPAAVHQARKRCKRLRGLLALYRRSMARRAAENGRLRQLGHDIGRLRDADSLVTAARGLRAHLAPDEGPELDPVVSALEERRDEIAATYADPEELRRLVAARMEALQDRVPAWRVDAMGWDAFERGFEREYERARAALEHFGLDVAPRELHELRKAVKRHWYHTRLIQDCWPQRLETRRSALASLGKILGEDHDLGILAATAPGLDLDEGALATLESTSHVRQIELRKRAGKLASDLFDASTETFVGSVGSHWARWAG